MEKEKKFNIIKLVIIIACAILFIGLILPYESAIGEHKEYLQKNPDTMNVKEINLTTDLHYFFFNISCNNTGSLVVMKSAPWLMSHSISLASFTVQALTFMPRS